MLKKPQKPKKLNDLTANEQALIIALREKFRYGEVIVIMRDGVPFRLKKVTEFEDLSKLAQKKS